MNSLCTKQPLNKGHPYIIIIIDLIIIDYAIHVAITCDVIELVLHKQ